VITKKSARRRDAKAFIEREPDSIGLAAQHVSHSEHGVDRSQVPTGLTQVPHLCLADARKQSEQTLEPQSNDLVNRVLLQPHWQNEVDLTDF